MSRLAAVIGLLYAGCATHPVHTGPVIYTPPAGASLAQLSVERVTLSDEQAASLASLPRHPADFGSRTLIEDRADTMQPAPWTSRLTILDAPTAREAVVVEFRNHASYGVSHVWLNEKLLFLRVWWGRIVTTECVLDLAAQKFLYREDANYFKTVYPAANEPRDPE